MKLILLLLLTCFNAHAADYFSVNVASHHWVRDQRFNEANAGVGFERVTGDYHKAVGFYKNSIRRTSFYLLGAYTPIHIGPFDAGVSGGTATGYNRGVVPVAAVIGSVTVGRIKLNAIATPNVPRLNVYGFVGFQLSYLIRR